MTAAAAGKMPVRRAARIRAMKRGTNLKLTLMLRITLLAVAIGVLASAGLIWRTTTRLQAEAVRNADPYRGMVARVDALRLHHDKRLAQIAALCDEPRHAFELLPRLFKRELDSFQTRFAMGEVIAHLNHLWQAGQLRRLPGQDGVIRFTQP